MNSGFDSNCWYPLSFQTDILIAYLLSHAVQCCCCCCCFFTHIQTFNWVNKINMITMSCATSVKLIPSLLLHLLEILRLVTGWVVKRCCLYPDSYSLERPRRSSWVISAAISLGMVWRAMSRKDPNIARAILKTFSTNCRGKKAFNPSFSIYYFIIFTSLHHTLSASQQVMENEQQGGIQNLTVFTH